MGTSPRTRELKSQGLDLRHSDVLLSEFALAVWNKSARYPPNGDTSELAAQRFEKLVEAIKAQDSAAADKVLRSWRIRK